MYTPGYSPETKYTLEQLKKLSATILRDVFRTKNGIMWEKFPRGKTPPPLPQYGNFFDEMPFFSEDVPKQKNFKIVKF